MPLFLPKLIVGRSVCVCVAHSNASSSLTLGYVSYESCFGNDTNIKETISSKNIYVIQALGSSFFIT